MRNIVSGIAIIGAFAWACLAAWHSLIIYRFGWPTFFLGQLFMAGPWLGLIFHGSIFWPQRIRRSYWGLFLAALSLGLVLSVAYFEISARFIGYK